jgi:hypothetical protein
MWEDRWRSKILSSVKIVSSRGYQLHTKRRFFLKYLPRNHSKIEPPKFLRVLDHIICANHQLVALQKILGTSGQKDK